jgi:hypothetical protein
MMEPESPDGIREGICSLAAATRRLRGEGRIGMAGDSWNTDWHDFMSAIEMTAAALARGRGTALDAHTPPHPTADRR